MSVNLQSSSESLAVIDPLDEVALALAEAFKAKVPTEVIVLPPSRAAKLVIASPEDRSVCSALLGDIKAQMKEVNERRLKRSRLLKKVDQLVNLDDYAAVAYFEGEKAVYEGKLRFWDEQQAILRAVEEARVRAETERIRQEEIAEARRIEAIEREKAAELRRQAEAELDADRREQALLDAAAREQEALQESAVRQEQAAMISTPVVAASGGKVKGETGHWDYGSELLGGEGDAASLRLLVKAVAEGRAPLKFLMFNKVGANTLADGLQEEFRAQYPEATCGVKLTKKWVYTHRKGRGK